MIYNLSGGFGIDLSALDNSSSYILSGKKYIGSSGAVVTGNIPTLDNTAVSLTTSSSSTTLSTGYLGSSKTISVSSESKAAYSSNIPINIFDANNTSVTTIDVLGSSNKFLTSVTGLPNIIRAGFFDSNSTTISSASDITSTIGGLNILPGKSLAIKYRAGNSDYTYKVNSALTYDNVNNKGRSIGFINTEDGSSAVTLTPGTNQIFNTIEYVPNVIALYTKELTSEPPAVDIIESSDRIVNGKYAVVEVKSGSNTAVKKYIKGTYTPSLQSIKSSISFSGTSGSASTQTITPGSGYVGLSSVTCVKNIRAWVASGQPTGYTNIGNTNVLQTGYYVKITADDGQGAKGAFITGTGPTPQTKACSGLTSYASDNHTATLTTATINPDSGKYLTSVSGVPSSMTVDWLNPNGDAWPKLSGTKVKIGTSTHLGSTYLVIRLKFGSTTYIYYVTPD